MPQPTSRLLAAAAAVATVLCVTMLTAQQSTQPSLGRRHKSAAAEEPREPRAPVGGSAPVPAPPESTSWAGWITSMLSGGSSGSAADIPTISVGTWKPGDPWPGGVSCDSGKLNDAMHMKPDIGCEPDCEQCQMVCLPSAFTGPFKNHGGELGSNCFERGCTDYAGEGSRSGVKFYMYDCDPVLQKQWKAMNSMSLEQAKLNLEQCLAACKKKDKSCILACEVTHKDEVANIAIKKQMSSGFAGEHGDAYQTGTVMGFILLCAIIVGVSGCFAIHAHHTTKPEGAKPPAAKGDKHKKVVPAALEGGIAINIDAKVIQIANDKDGQLCALTEDGRVFTWTAADAAKARGSLEANLQRSTPAASEPEKPRALETRPQQATPAAPEPRPVATEAKPPANGDAAPAAQPARKKQSISELKKSVTAIRAVS